jgi:Flp pilus assembly protein TadD
MALAAQLKDQGNEEFRQGNYLKAAALYTKAIKEEPQNAVLYRCGAPSCLSI